MKKIVVAIIFSVCLGARIFAYGTEEVGKIRIDAENFLFTDGIFETEDGYSFTVRSLNKGQYEPVNGKKIKYTITRFSINCKDKTYKPGTIDSYGFYDEFVNGDYNRHAKYLPVVEGTALSVITNDLCNP